jgi:hypothetical protein
MGPSVHTGGDRDSELMRVAVPLMTLDFKFHWEMLLFVCSVLIVLQHVRRWCQTSCVYIMLY